MRTRIIFSIVLLSCITYAAILRYTRLWKYTGADKAEIFIAKLSQHAQGFILRHSSDPSCHQSRSIYSCSGTCPWSNTDDGKLVSCSFLPRKLHPDFVKYNIYCTPDPDNCPTYNPWLKDLMPPIRKHIQKIPDNLLSNFTLDYRIGVEFDRQHFRKQDSLPENWTVALINSIRKQVRAREAFGLYSNKDIYPALDKYAELAISNRKCAVVGSEAPWIEAALLEYNASSVTTIEYATIYSSVPRLFTINPKDFAKQHNNKTKRQVFDSVWSYSSIEHDGLGRYTDPLNPYGDLQTMAKLTCVLKPGGYLFLGVPLNAKDFIQFNLHRLYGPIRLPLLYRNFHIVEVLGANITIDKYEHRFQPFVVLQNKIGCK